MLCSVCGGGNTGRAGHREEVGAIGKAGWWGKAGPLDGRMGCEGRGRRGKRKGRMAKEGEATGRAGLGEEVGAIEKEDGK